MFCEARIFESIVEHLEVILFRKLHHVDKVKLNLAVKSIFIHHKNTCELHHTLDLLDPKVIEE